MSEPASRPTGSRRTPNPALLLWLAASYFLLVPPLLRWMDVPAPARLAAPLSPVDRTLWRYAEEWLFLQRARALVPSGATVTVRALERPREVSLYILSLGLLPAARPVPGRYYDQPSEHAKRGAEYVLSFRCAPPAEAGLRRIATFEDGCVFRRSRGAVAP